MQKNKSVYHITIFNGVHKMHSCGWADGSAEIVDSEPKSAAQKLLIAYWWIEDAMSAAASRRFFQ